MNLPRHYETAGLPDYDGTVWFRRALELPAARAGKPLTLELGPIDDMDMTWFNGKLVGAIERPGFWAAPRKYTVKGPVVKAGRNVIVVRVIDHGWPGGFAGKAAQMRVSGRGLKPISIAGDWKFQPGVTLKALGLGALARRRLQRGRASALRVFRNPAGRIAPWAPRAPSKPGLARRYRLPPAATA